MRALTKSEKLTIIIILLIVFGITSFNMNISIRRARDSQRRSDMGTISDALEKFRSEYGYFPPAKNGKIKMCRGDNFDEIITKVRAKSSFDRELFFEGLRECEWGTDALADVLDTSSTPYLSAIPSDPLSNKGYSYLYLSNTVRYQLYTFLEGEEEEIGYNRATVGRTLSCGAGTCSYGKSYGATPLDTSIEDYESELLKNSGQ